MEYGPAHTLDTMTAEQAFWHACTNTPIDTIIPRIVHEGYNAVSDELWYRFETGETRCLDAVKRGAISNYAESPTAEYIYRHGRDPYDFQVNLK